MRPVSRGAGSPARASSGWPPRRPRSARSSASSSATRTELREVRAELEHARGDEASHSLPPAVEDAIARAREEHLTYLKADNLRALAAVVVDLEADSRPGLLIEAGAARGGSAIVIAAAKAAERPMKVYDVFGMIPPPTERDGADVHKRYEKIAGGEAKGPGGETYYGYRDDLYDEVTESFSRLGVPLAEHNVELVRGLFEDTIVLDEPVAFAHLDGDWYESTMTCLTRIAPLLVPGRPDRARRLLQVVRLPDGGRRVLQGPRRVPARAAREAARRP